MLEHFWHDDLQPRALLESAGGSGSWWNDTNSETQPAAEGSRSEGLKAGVGKSTWKGGEKNCSQRTWEQRAWEEKEKYSHLFPECPFV